MTKRCHVKNIPSLNLELLNDFFAKIIPQTPKIRITADTQFETSNFFTCSTIVLLGAKQNSWFPGTGLPIEVKRTVVKLDNYFN